MTATLTARADSAFDSKAFINACRDHHVRFSVTVRIGVKPIPKAIAAVHEDAWVLIKYWLDGGADEAETTYTAFKDTRDAVTLRLVLRRVQPTPGPQLALDVVSTTTPVPPIPQPGALSPGARLAHNRCE